LAVAIDQVTLRRRGTGLIGWERGAAFDGYTLFAPMMGDGTVLLIDMEGNVAHQWRMPYPPGDYGRLLPDGHLFYCGKTPDTNPRFPTWPLFKGGAVMEVDWEGNTVWELKHPDHHHDARLTTDGTVLLLTIERVPEEIAERVQGGLSGTEHSGMWADRILEVTKGGDVVWEWHAYEHLDPAADRLGPHEWREEWTHGNTVLETPQGGVMVSFRNISTVAVIDRRTGDFVWKLGPPALAQQHDPQVLDNGNILVFDNGVHRENSPLSYSRVAEIDPRTKRTAWEYRDLPLQSFFSPYISGAQRLPNGNTLICEGCTGRLFEVTPDRRVVWEYISPYFSETPLLGTNNWVFRAFRYSREDLRRWSGGTLG